MQHDGRETGGKEERAANDETERENEERDERGDEGEGRKCFHGDVSWIAPENTAPQEKLQKSRASGGNGLPGTTAVRWRTGGAVPTAPEIAGEACNAG